MMEKPVSQKRRSSSVHLNITKQLGSGKFQVFHTRMLPDNKEYALKMFPKTHTVDEVYQRESSILSKLSHENIIRYVPIKNFIHENKNCNYILTEYASHGTFFDLVANKELNNEKLMRSYFHQLIKGLEYLHDQGIAHLDLKLENLLLGNNFLLKIADFDQSQNVRENQLLFFGTPCYRAPEVLTKNCQDFGAADVYSAGIVLFILKAGCFPFMETGEEACKTLIHYDLFIENNKEFWHHKVAERTNKEFFNEDFKELVNGMLAKDPLKRWTLNEIKSSKWFNGPTFSSNELKSEMEKVWERMNYKKYVRK